MTLAVWGISVLTLALSSVAQELPVYVFTSQTLYNERGDILHGDGASAPGERALVLILEAESGVFPPALNGEPDALNPVMPGGMTGIGNLISPSLVEPGRFAVSLTGPRPAAGTVFFARAYNLSDTADSLYYKDSDTMTIVQDELVTYDAQFPSEWTHIDVSRDTDGDQLPDWWEHLHFLGATNAVADDLVANQENTVLQAYIAGLDPTDELSSFFIEAEKGVGLSGETVHVLRWPSVEGRVYDIYYSTNLVDGVFLPLAGAENLVASPDWNLFTNQAPITTDSVYYRAIVRME